MSRPRTSKVNTTVPAVRRIAATRTINRAFPLLSRFDRDTGRVQGHAWRLPLRPHLCGCTAVSPTPRESVRVWQPSTWKVSPSYRVDLRRPLSLAPARTDPVSPGPRVQPIAASESFSCCPSRFGKDKVPCGMPYSSCTHMDKAISLPLDSPPDSPTPPRSEQKSAPRKEREPENYFSTGACFCVTPITCVRA